MPVVRNYLIPASFLGLLSPADLALGYKPLQRVEEAWRTRKSGRRVRSVYHWAVHVLGLWLARVIAQACGNTGRHMRADVEQRKLAPLLRPHGEVWPVTAPAPEASPH